MIKGKDIGLTLWIGAEGAMFTRVQVAFEKAGYQAPTPDVSGGGGAYVSNIVNQFQADLTEAEVKTLIAYATRHSLPYLKANRRSLRQLIAAEAEPA